MPYRIEACIEISAPLTVVYGRAARFEKYPDFLPGLAAVAVLSGDRVRFEAEVGGVRQGWEAHIAERVRHRRLVLVCSDPMALAGALEFQLIARGITELTAAVEYELDPVRARLAELLLEPRRQLEDGLRRFKDIVEHERHSPAVGSGAR